MQNLRNLRGHTRITGTVVRSESVVLVKRNRVVAKTVETVLRAICWERCGAWLFAMATIAPHAAQSK
jgi:hypothetical protein